MESQATLVRLVRRKPVAEEEGSRGMGVNDPLDLSDDRQGEAQAARAA
jgi:hypothetical protein